MLFFKFTRLRIYEFASCLACPSLPSSSGFSGILVILVPLGFLGILDFLAISLQADKCRLSLSARSFP